MMLVSVQCSGSNVFFIIFNKLFTHQHTNLYEKPNKSFALDELKGERMHDVTFDHQKGQQSQPLHHV